MIKAYIVESLEAKGEATFGYYCKKCAMNLMVYLPVRMYQIYADIYGKKCLDCGGKK